MPSYGRIDHSFGPLAQWLEQGTHNPLVLGSNPRWPTYTRPWGFLLKGFWEVVHYPQRGFIRKGILRTAVEESMNLLYKYSWSPKKIRSCIFLPGVCKATLREICYRHTIAALLQWVLTGVRCSLYQIVGSSPTLGKQDRRGYWTSPELGTGTKLEIVDNVVILEHLKVEEFLW